MKPVFALIDCNNFYVSCERLFDPALRHRGVVVLSNNDGCIVSRSNEVKKLGIKMGVPLFQARQQLQRHNIAVLSSNYTLYADMSARVMETLSQFTDDMEVYSIDEAFLAMPPDHGDLTSYGRQMRHTVTQWTGIPVSVGIGSTKTLAKLANRIAKTSARADGVLDLTCSQRHLDIALDRTDVADLWGVGHATAQKLKATGITTALDLRNADLRWIKRHLGIMGVRTVLELRGTVCYDLETNPPAKKGITVSRSFGAPIVSIDMLTQALSTYIPRAAEKLRDQHLAAHTMTLYAMTNRFDTDHWYYGSHTVEFQTATNDTLQMLHDGLPAVKKIFKNSASFNKAGVMLCGLVPENKVQGNLFDTRDRVKSRRLMQAIDTINSGSGAALFMASQGIQRPWQTRFQYRSGRYTTCWDELPVVS